MQVRVSILLFIIVDQLIKIVPDNVSHLLLQCIAGTLGGFTTTIITNPLDVCRARLQVMELPKNTQCVSKKKYSFLGSAP